MAPSPSRRRSHDPDHGSFAGRVIEEAPMGALLHETLWRSASSCSLIQFSMSARRYMTRRPRRTDGGPTPRWRQP